MLEIVKIEEIFFSLTKIYIISVRWHNDEYRGGPVLRGYSGIQFALNVYNHKQNNCRTNWIKCVYSYISTKLLLVLWYLCFSKMQF